ncbi:hypothetical protein OAA60_00805 [Porticoccaceae bacterium]|nr:hypothetical protein [Porticoccaceae bacterium]
MTREKLHSKSDIAAELAWRDSQTKMYREWKDRVVNSTTRGRIEQLKAEVATTKDALEMSKERGRNEIARLEAEIKRLVDSPEIFREWLNDNGYTTEEQTDE